MPKRYTTEQIVGMLHEVQAIIEQGDAVLEACRKIGISEMGYYRWRKAFIERKFDYAARVDELEIENSRLRRAVSQLVLDKLISREADRDERADRNGIGEPRSDG